MNTKRVLAEMFLENSGIGLTDSGGLDGRAWQRHRREVGDGDAVAYFDSQPEVKNLSHCGPVGSTWHYLVDRCEYDEELDAEFYAWCDENDAYPGHYDSAEDFIRDRWGERGRDFHLATIYTYNGENVLDHDIHFTIAAPADESDEYVLLSIHTGADARWGLSSYHVFRLTSYDGVYSFLDYNELDCWCHNEDCTNEDGHRPDFVEFSGTSLYDQAGGGSHYVDFDDEWNALCPYCKEILGVSLRCS